MNPLWALFLAGVLNLIALRIALSLPKSRPISEWDHRDWAHVYDTEVIE